MCIYVHTLVCNSPRTYVRSDVPTICSRAWAKVYKITASNTGGVRMVSGIRHCRHWFVTVT